MRDKAATIGAPEPHPVAMVVYDGVSPFDIGVVCEIFGGDYAADFGVPWYRLSVCAASAAVTRRPASRCRSPAAWRRYGPPGP